MIRFNVKILNSRDVKKIFPQISRYKPRTNPPKTSHLAISLMLLNFLFVLFRDFFINKSEIRGPESHKQLTASRV